MALIENIKDNIEINNVGKKYLPDYYIEDVNVPIREERVNTNSRYPYFKQRHFTAGDEEQFFRYSKMGGTFYKKVIGMRENLHKNYETIPKFDKYLAITSESMLNTFFYIFNKYKKGIYVVIKDNELKTFLPFSKANFVNEWGELIKQDPRFETMDEFFFYISNMEKRNFNPKRINRITSQWYANNAIFRYEFPVGEGDRNVNTIRDMLLTLCSTRKLPDVECFINRRDFPLLMKDGTEAYYHIFGKGKQLISHNYNSYCPILSMTSEDNTADIPIPTWDDWARVRYEESKIVFPPKMRTYKDKFDIPFSKRIPKAVFRGTSTGVGTNIDTNIRLKASYLSNKYPNLLDAGITRWNLRPRKSYDKEHLTTIDIQELPFTLVNELTIEEQGNYKYMLHLDGHVSAFRYSYEFKTGCVILKPKSKYKLWFEHLLTPNVHYIEINENLDDLIDTILWCNDHPIECEKIAINGRNFYNKYLSKNSILDYWQKVFVDIRATCGNYSYPENTISNVLYERERDILNKLLSTNNIIEEVLHDDKRNFNNILGIKNIIGPIDNIFDNPNIEITTLKKTSKSTIYSGNIKNKSTLALKMSYKYRELAHEAFVGITCINDIIKYIPNFSYTYGLINYNNSLSNVLVSEVLKGNTFESFISRPQFNINNYISILISLSLSLQFAQERCGFVHYDLYPWNIIILTLDSPMEITYKLNSGDITIYTDIIPVMMDYGKSHVVYENIHHGLVRPFSFSSIQDILSILVSSLYIVLSRYSIRYEEKRHILTLANFIANTGYTKYKTFNNFTDIKDFTNSAKKYAELIYGNKYELEGKSSLDFYKYLIDKRLTDCVKLRSNTKYIKWNDNLTLTSFLTKYTYEQQTYNENTFFNPYKIYKCLMENFENKKLDNTLLYIASKIYVPSKKEKIYADILHLIKKILMTD